MLFQRSEIRPATHPRDYPPCFSRSVNFVSSLLCSTARLSQSKSHFARSKWIHHISSCSSNHLCCLSRYYCPAEGLFGIKQANVEATRSIAPSTWRYPVESPYSEAYLDQTRMIPDVFLLAAREDFSSRASPYFPSRHDSHFSKITMTS